MDAYPFWWILSRVDVARGLVGGGLIGLSAAVFLLFHGEIAGISGLCSSVLQRTRHVHRIAFIGSLVAVGALLRWLWPSAFGSSAASLPLLAVAGLLVGFGARVGSGCTSGHGVCGMSRGSPRSIVATLVFMGAAAVTVFAIRRLGA